MGSSPSKTRVLNRVMKDVKRHYSKRKEYLRGLVTQLSEIEPKLESASSDWTGLRPALGALVSGVGGATGVVLKAVSKMAPDMIQSFIHSEEHAKIKSLRKELVLEMQSVKEKLVQAENSLKEIKENHRELYDRKKLFKLESSVSSLRLNITSACRSEKSEDFKQVLSDLDTLCKTV